MVPKIHQPETTSELSQLTVNILTQGIGPVYAIPKLLSTHGLSLNDIDVIEINEAFASMAVYCRDKLGIEWEKLNPRGECKKMRKTPP